MRILAIVLGVALATGASIPVPIPREKPDVSIVDELAATQAVPDDFGRRLAAMALTQTRMRTTYDASYQRIAYPGGDVPPDKGVCADVVIRAYRGLGIDLQVLVHKDMVKAFARYPWRWGLKRTDTNIDHRRVPNLETFLQRHGSAVPVSAVAHDYKPGDLVSWTVGGSLPHIGIVSAHRSKDGVRPLIVHNIGEGTKLEDVLFEFPIVGHFRYRPSPPRG